MGGLRNRDEGGRNIGSHDCRCPIYRCRPCALPCFEVVGLEHVQRVEKVAEFGIVFFFCVCGLGEGFLGVVERLELEGDLGVEDAEGGA